MKQMLGIGFNAAKSKCFRVSIKG